MLSDDAVAIILEENLKTKNYELQRRICNIAKGNIRLAIMAGVRLKYGKKTLN